MSDTPDKLYLDLGSIPVGKDLPVKAYRGQWHESLLEYTRTDLVPRWIPVSEGLPESGRPVWAFYKNVFGKTRMVKAKWIDDLSVEADHEHDDLDMVYSEEKDTYYWPKGWYEMIDNWDEYSAVTIYQGEITYWMPLPAPPEGDDE